MRRLRYSNGQLKPLTMSLTRDEAMLRMAKQDIRVGMARQIASSRGLAALALNNTAFLRRRLTYAWIALAALASVLGWSLSR